MSELMKYLSPKSKSNSHFDNIGISIASPETIRSWSLGEVKKPETINYRTFKPEKDGLFCARIFGPEKDYECLCGKYRRMKHKGIVCEKCGVEVTLSRVRRERMGHIELAAPVAHIWFLKISPSTISTLLDLTVSQLEKILYFEKYIVTEPGTSPLKLNETLTEEGYIEAIEEYGDDFSAGIGAEAIRDMLKNLNLEEEAQNIKESLSELSSTATKRPKLIKRLRLIENFIKSGNKPEWMILTVLPVIPPEIRPLVPLDGGRFATSDLNDLYRRVINRNNRLKRLLELGSPDIIIRNEKRMLQEAVDALFDNTRRSRPLVGNSRRPLKSLSDMLKGKQGRFRQNLLGKRVDYSGRSVITVGPSLKLYQCGLPKKMALELFKPFIYAKLELYGISPTIKAAKRKVEREEPEVWDILEEVIHEHPVLLNRAPTLHRLGIQAFEPILVEGKAIRLHPLVCTAFNADFDGDQMAVHVPLSLEAQLEARVLMLASNNILLPSNGSPVIVPSQDMILGLYYLTLDSTGDEIGTGMLFSDIGEIEHALHSGVVSLHAKITARYTTIDEAGNKVIERVETTPGRYIVSTILPKNSKIPYSLVNKLLTKKEISNLLVNIFRYTGQKQTVEFADEIMQLGFKHACISGISFGKDDMVIPHSKEGLISKTKNQINELEEQYQEGLITSSEKYNKAVDIWTSCSSLVADEMMKEISETKPGKTPNSVYMMANSGARGSKEQMRQLGGMRGLMAKPNGDIIEIPIISNFKEGLSVMEYFNSTHGARKGLADTALKTASSGYLTRRLVDVAQDCTVIEEDCKTDKYVTIVPMFEGSKVISSLGERIIGRTLAKDLFSLDGNLIIKKGDIVTEEISELIDKEGIESAEVRSALTCDLKVGVCASCYGLDLSTNRKVNIGEAVGIVAAQSIGEPGTQLTMRTFHVGGTAQSKSEQSSYEAHNNGIVKLENCKYVVDSQSRKVVMSNNAEIVIMSEQEEEKELERYRLQHGCHLFLEDGQVVSRGEKLVSWDPYTIPIISEFNGIVKFDGIKSGSTVEEMIDESTGITSRRIVDSKNNSRLKSSNLVPRIMLLDEKTGKHLTINDKPVIKKLVSKTILVVKDNDLVHAGDILAHIPRKSIKTSDITGGLPRVADLFEARVPSDVSIMCDVDGRITYGKEYKNKNELILTTDDGEEYKYSIPKSRTISVQDGSLVRKGDMLMSGSPSVHDILRIKGLDALSDYIVREVQEVYKNQGVIINDKHIEVILSQMLRKVQVVSSGDTIFLEGEEIEKYQLEDIFNNLSEGDTPPVFKPILLGVTKAALRTESFISAASFQETTKVLANAAVAGKIDNLIGLKENIIVGRLIPAGTGSYVRKLREIANNRDQEFLQEQEKIKLAELEVKEDANEIDLN